MWCSVCFVDKSVLFLHHRLECQHLHDLFFPLCHVSQNNAQDSWPIRGTFSFDLTANRQLRRTHIMHGKRKVSSLLKLLEDSYYTWLSPTLHSRLELVCRDLDTLSDEVLVDAVRNKSAGRVKHTHVCDMQSGSERNTREQRPQSRPTCTAQL